MKRLLNYSGLTLIEVIVTLAVLGVVVTPLMSMFLTSQRINSQSHNEYKAVQIAQEYMEEIKSMESLNMSLLDLDSYNDVNEEHITGDALREGYNLHIDANKLSGDAASIADINWDKKIKISNNIKITVDNDKIKFSDFSDFGEAIFVHKNIKLTLTGLSSDISIDVTNLEDEKLTIYIVNDEPEYKAHVNVLEGKAGVVETVSHVKPSNFLYEINIKVNKDGKEINTVSGTAIFRY